MANLSSLVGSSLVTEIPDNLFPATLPAVSGENLTNLNASNVSSGILTTSVGGTGLTTIGTANQVLAVNSGGTALEYQTVSAGISTGKAIAMAIVFG